MRLIASIETENSLYPIETINGKQAIQAQTGPNLGKYYAILGSCNPCVRIRLDQLERCVNHKLEKGLCVVARLLDDTGKYVPPSLRRKIIMQTSPIKKINYQS